MVALCIIIVIVKTNDEIFYVVIVLLQIRKHLTIIPISNKNEDSTKMVRNKKYD